MQRNLVFLFFCACLAVTAWSGAASAQATNDTKVSELKRRADEAFDALHYAEAVDAYDSAYAISKDPALLYNKGRALQALGRNPEALEELERFQAEASPDLKSRVPKLAELIAEVRAKITTLSLSSNVGGARVVVYDRVVGTTPLGKPLKLKAGRTTVEVTADGYAPFTRTVELVGGGTLMIDATLVAKTRSGVLTVRSTTPNALVAIDGKIVGNAPTEAAVEAGEHKIAVRAEGFESSETVAIVAAGEHKVLDMTLYSGKPITSKWWFWTGVGVVVAGSVALTVALLTERSPGSGDFQPGRVSALIRF